MNDTPREKAEDLIAALCAVKRAITAPELGRLLCVSSRLIYRMVADGELPAIRVCGCIRFSPTAVAQWLRENSGSRVSRKKASNPLTSTVKNPVKSAAKKTYIKVS